MLWPDDPVEALLDRFDFASLRGALRGAGRRWRGGPGREFYPAQAHLRRRARQLLERLRDSPDRDFVRDGGFVARRCGAYWTLTYELETAAHEGPAPEGARRA